MSIVTKTGDQGSTALMYNRRVSKCHPRVVASGGIDELNAALGLARAATNDVGLKEKLAGIQKDLIGLMGEISTLPEDGERYRKDGYAQISSTMTAGLEQQIAQIESQKISYKGWATPGANPSSAALDMARTICRRAERGVCALKEGNEPVNAEIIVYLNRLSDLLWLCARQQEKD